MNLGRRLRAEAERGLAAHGLSFRHLSALGHLGRQPGLSYSELARRAAVTAQSMQATLRHLESLGAVERRTEPGRGRRAQLHLTEVGVRLRDAGQGVITEADERLLDGFSGGDRELLGTLLLRAFVAMPDAS